MVIGDGGTRVGARRRFPSRVGTPAIRGAKLSTLVLLAGIAGPRGGAAQTAPLLLEVPASTEAMAFGNAPNLYGRDANLLFYAPAFLREASGASLGLQRFGSDGTLASVAGVTEQNDVGIAVGLQYMRYGADDLVRGQDIQSVALMSGDLGVSEFVASIGFSKRYFGVEAGVVAKFVEQSIDGSSDHTEAFDFGLGKDLGPVMLGLTARNLGSNLEGGGELPSQIAIGLTSAEFQVGALDMFVTSQFLRRRDGEVIPAGGLEISYWPVRGYTFRLRAGAQRVVDDQRSPLTFGAAFTGDGITFEYAFQAFDQEGSAHRFGFRWR